VGSPPPLPVAVVDIDGVVADVRHRLGLLAERPKRWDAFFAAAPEDATLPEGVALVLALRQEHEVVWLTGRPERNRAITESWLRKHGLPLGRLLMRRDDDRRPARHGKREALRALSTERRIALVVDDDPAVVRELQADGFPVRQATWLPHSSTLRKAQNVDGET